jgi:hypothetical protein
MLTEFGLKAGLVTIVCVALAVAKVASERWIGNYGLLMLFHKVLPEQPPAAAKPPPPIAWAQHTVAGLSIESPWRFRASRKKLPDRPPGAQQLIRRMDTYIAKTPAYAVVYVTVVEYPFKADMNTVDAALDTGVRYVAEKLDDNDPKYTVNQYTVNQADLGKIAHYLHRSVGLDLLVFARANKLWMICILYFDADYFDTFMRIIQSVKLID